MVTTAKSSLDEVSKTGAFVRSASGFRNFISSESDLYKPESGRYHLYVSHACPWANRCYLVRHMKGLQEVIGLTVVHPTWQRTKPHNSEDNHYGWIFTEPGQTLQNQNSFGEFAFQDTTMDPNNPSVRTVRDLYEISNDTLGKHSVPVLWDTKTKTIVNNESSEIIVMFNSAFNQFAKRPELDLAPTSLD